MTVIQAPTMKSKPRKTVALLAVISSLTACAGGGNSPKQLDPWSADNTSDTLKTIETSNATLVPPLTIGQQALSPELDDRKERLLQRIQIAGALEFGTTAKPSSWGIGPIHYRVDITPAAARTPPCVDFTLTATRDDTTQAISSGKHTACRNDLGAWRLIPPTG